MTPDAMLEQDFGFITDLIRSHARQQPAHAALIKDAQSLNYAGLDSLMDRIAASLQRDGLNSGDVIAICGLSGIEYGAVFLGALRAGIAVAPLAASSTPQSLGTMLADCGARVLFPRAGGRGRRHCVAAMGRNASGLRGAEAGPWRKCG